MEGEFVKKNYLPKLLVIVAVIGLGYGYYNCKISKEELKNILIGTCTFWPADWGTKPPVCAFVNQIGPGGRSSACVGCEFGYSFGYCKDDEIGYGSPYGYSSHWENDNSKKFCGKTVQLPNGSMGCMDVSTCVQSGGGIAQNHRSSEYINDANFIPLPPILKALSPSNTARIYQSSSIQIQFDKSTQSDSFTFSGSIGSNIGNQFQINRADLFNDRLVIPGQSNRAVGVGRILNVKGLDIDGKEIDITLMYSVQQDGVPMDPSTSTCQPECQVNWLNSYSIQFDASGGFPPYQWYIAGDPNAYPPGVNLSTSGLLTGPATANFLGLYPFTVIVIDATGNMQVFPVLINSIDEIAACFFAGICG
ncbi:Ig domain-containing protein [Leptospira santarosai]|uniref:Ig domain-containing protein n=1 Tax=Leptospira santarosai TaxID=28183 RepID=UPI000774676D|nr:Ig domain-containing protein [Leptospira santarosai]MDI7203271.1 Ig domain-containing protein [Leptospira santarosai]